MKRLLNLGVTACLLLAFWPNSATAQPLPTLTLNGVDGNVTVMAGTLINLVTDEDSGIYEYSTADCSGGVAFVYGNTRGVARGTATSVGFAPFRAGVVGTCRVATWTAGPTFTLNGVEGNISVEAGQPITFVANPADFQLNAYSGEFCTGTLITRFDSGTTRTETTATTYYVLAQWPALDRRACRTATWTVPPPAEAPPLTLNGVAANATLTVGETAFLATDPAATISLFENADCSDPLWLARPGGTSVVPTIAGTYSFQAWWNDFPDLKSACLIGTWLDPAPIGPPPLTIDGVTADASLTVGDTATIETAPTASLLYWFGTADCTDGPGTVGTAPATATSASPFTISYRAFWIELPDIESECLNAVWIASVPTPTSTTIPTAIPTETVTATLPPGVTPTVTATSVPTATATLAVVPTAGTTVTSVTTPPARATGAPMVTSLPNTGSEPASASLAIVATASALIIVVGVAGAYRFIQGSNKS